MNLRSFIFIALFLISNSLSAKITLLIPDAFNVISVNGYNYSKSLFSSNRLLNLQPGENKIAIEYEVLFESSDEGGFDIIKSKILIVKAYLQPNKHYQLQYIKQINAKAAKKYILNPVLKLIEKNGSKLKHSQFFPNISSSEHLNNKTKRSFKPLESIQITSNKIQQNHIEKKLLYWWNKANKEEQKSFLEIIQEIPSSQK